MHRAKTLATMNSESIGKYTSNSRRVRVGANRHLLVAVMSACRFLGILIKIEVIHHFADLYYTCPGIDIKILLLRWWLPEVVLLEFPANAAMWQPFFRSLFPRVSMIDVVMSVAFTLTRSPAGWSPGRTGCYPIGKCLSSLSVLLFIVVFAYWSLCFRSVGCEFGIISLFLYLFIYSDDFALFLLIRLFKNKISVTIPWLPGMIHQKILIVLI